MDAGASRQGVDSLSVTLRRTTSADRLNGSKKRYTASTTPASKTSSPEKASGSSPITNASPKQHSAKSPVFSASRPIDPMRRASRYPDLA